MLSLDSIEATILELENKDTTFSNCERLAPLYIVRDHIKRYSAETGTPIDAQGNGEFFEAINGKNSAKVWKILDELLNAVRALHPKMYASVLDKIREL